MSRVYVVTEDDTPVIVFSTDSEAMNYVVGRSLGGLQLKLEILEFVVGEYGRIN